MKNLDLNLLRVFDTLIELRSVNDAADQLHLTPSAVSHALRRLREFVGDPLFVRSPGGLRPTTRATDIAPGIREALARVRETLQPSLVDPAKAKRRFTLAAGSYFCTLLVPRLIGRLRAIAPGISINVVRVGTDLFTALDEGRVDLVFGANGRLPPRISTEPLLTEDRVWIAAAGNPVVHQSADARHVAALPRVTFSMHWPFEVAEAPPAEGDLDPRHLPEHVMTVYDALTAIAIVGNSDMVAQVPRRFAQINARQHGIVILDTAGVQGGFEVALLWHNRLQHDPGLIWLRSLIHALATR